MIDEKVRQEISEEAHDIATIKIAHGLKNTDYKQWLSTVLPVLSKRIRQEGTFARDCKPSDDENFRELVREFWNQLPITRNEAEEICAIADEGYTSHRDRTISFHRDADTYCSHAVIGKYLGTVKLKFANGKKKVMVYYQGPEQLIFIDAPIVGVPAIIGDNGQFVYQENGNRKKLDKLFSDAGLPLIQDHDGIPSRG